MFYSVVCFSAWLKDTVDPMLVTLDHRIAALTGLDVQPPYAEYLQVVNYGIGGHYEPHFDHATVTRVNDQSPEAKANTFLVFVRCSSYRTLRIILNEILEQWFLFKEYM